MYQNTRYSGEWSNLYR